jgi:2-C-methyl-D-erythritol 4-phosphate cytidylyltransferase
MERDKYVVIMAAGSGSRMGAQMPKQFLEIDGKAILQRTIEVFLEAIPDVKVITVLPKEFIGYWKDYCLNRNFICPQVLVPGGITRFHSVKNALEHVPQGAIVAVHDGVRPFVPKEMLHTLLNYDFAKENVAGVIPVMPSIESMRMWTYGQDGMPNGSKTVNRDEYMFVQTPQVFDSTILKECYKKPYSPEFTDDASVVESCGYKVATAPGSRFNIKLTTPEDLVMARIFLSIMEEK